MMTESGEKVTIKINGLESGIRTTGLSTMGDLIELIKGSIDPEHMITGLLINGRDLADAEWNANLGQLGTVILEVETGSPQEFVASRFAQAADVVRTCYIDFRDARKCFQGGDMARGNQRLVHAVNTLRAFFEWYGTMCELVPESERANYDLGPQVNEISEVCKRICQQQLYQSWWALGETLEKELEPQLDKLEDFCRKFTVSN